MSPSSRRAFGLLAMLAILPTGPLAGPMVQPPAWAPTRPGPRPRMLVRLLRARLAPDGSRRLQHYRLVRADRDGSFGDPVSLLYRPAGANVRVVLAAVHGSRRGPGPGWRDLATGSAAERCLEVVPGPGDPGDLFEVLLEEDQGSPAMGADDFAPAHWFGTEDGVDLDMLEVTVPEARELRYLARGLGAASEPTVRAGPGGRVLAWALRGAKAEKGRARPYVRTSALGSWAQVRDWFAPRLAPRLAVGPGVRAAALELAPRSAGEQQVVAAAWQRVADRLGPDEATRDGPEAVLGRSAEEVLRRSAGNCADRANLFCALLKARGIRADPILVARAGHRALDPQLPSFVPGDHALARVWVGGRETWVDPSEPGLGFPGVAPGLIGRLGWDPVSGAFHRIEGSRFGGSPIERPEQG